MSGSTDPNSGPALGGLPNQWLRKAEVIITNAGDTKAATTTYSFNEDFLFTFNTVQRDAKTFNTARVRLHNLSNQTINRLIGLASANVPSLTAASAAAALNPNPAAASSTAVGEDAELPQLKIIIKAGYQTGSYGTVFQGYVTQWTHGKESNVNSYLDIFGSDGDNARFVVLNQTLAGPVTQQMQWNALIAAGKQQTGIDFSNGQNLLTQSGGILPRGKVMYGAFPDYAEKIGANRRETWSILNGKLVRVPWTGYLPGTIVDINSHTGLIGTPETTESGLTFICLLNPNIFLGQRVRLNNREVNQTIVTNPNARGPDEALNFSASEASDGVYRVVVHEFSGTTRGQEWYSHITCLAIDVSAPGSNSVQLGEL